MASGVVKWYNNAKGFGFIKPDEEGEDVFLHHSGISSSFVESVREGVRLSYEVQRGPKGPTAVSVREWKRWED